MFLEFVAFVIIVFVLSAVLISHVDLFILQKRIGAALAS